MQATDVPPPKSRQRLTVQVLIGALGVLILLGGIVLLDRFLLQQRQDASTVADGSIGSTRTTFDGAQFFADQVEPALRTLESRNAESVERALATVRGHFQQARSGAPAFAESIIGPLDSIKSLYLRARGAALRWWLEDANLQPALNHVRWNYERHVTSGPRIQETVLAAINAMRADLQANRNETIQSVASTLKGAELPVVLALDRERLEAFCQEEFERSITAFNDDGKPAEWAAGGTALAMVAAVVTERAVVFVLARAVAAAGGSALGGGTAGAGAGTLLPGAGTGIGAMAGILAGFAMDAWISNQTKARTVEEVKKSLDEIENAILKGSDEKPGLEALFERAARRQVEGLRSKLREQVGGVAK